MRDELADLVERERQRFGVPGCAVAVVRDGEVLLEQGFGVTDLETGAPVGAETPFPIASDTKCFTAAVLSQLSAEGVLDLDAPVRDVLPWFRMADETATQLVSVRDLLAHRTGLPRHDLVWYGYPDLDLEGVARSLAHLPLSRQVRQTWQYNNLAYSTAGHVTEVLTGLAWEDAVQQRLLDPLGMTATGFWDGSQALASPWSDVAGELQRQQLPAVSRLRPPGGMVSTVRDLATWALARLGRNPEVLDAAALGQLHTPAMLGGAGVGVFPERAAQGYALGCQVEAYRGHTVVSHGGNLVGFASNVAVLPSLDGAVVILTNRHGTSLRDAIVPMVVDRLAGLDPLPWGERYLERETTMREGARAAKASVPAAGRPPARPAAELAGTYRHPAYGDLTLTEDLAVEYHGLGERLRLVHRDRDAYDLDLVELELRFAVTVVTDADDEVVGLTLPFEALTPPVLFSRVPPPVDPAVLVGAPGTYAMGPLTVTLRAVGQDLELTAPQVGTVRLLPARGGSFGVSGQPAVRVTVDGDALTVVPLGVFRRTTAG